VDVAVNVGVAVRVGGLVGVAVGVFVDDGVMVAVSVGNEVRVRVKVGVRVVVRVAVGDGVPGSMSVIESNAVAVRPLASRYLTYTVLVPAPGVKVQLIFETYGCHCAFAKSALFEI